MVDDLNFLKRGGRISGSAALAGSIMHLKPILKGDEEGKLVLDLKILGRKKAIKTLMELFEQLHVANQKRTISSASRTPAARTRRICWRRISWSTIRTSSVSVGSV